MVQKHGYDEGRGKQNCIRRNMIPPVNERMHNTRPNTKSRTKTRDTYTLSPSENKHL
jgi:hypothetical protein